MNIHDYLQQASQINQTLVRDPQTLLALTVAWLDPLAILKDQEILVDEEISDYYYSGDTMGEGLYVTRRCFPDIYARAISKLRTGVPFREVLSFIDDEIENQTQIPTSQFEEGHAYAFGIPLPWYGFEVEDPDFSTDHEDEWHLIKLFGVGIDDNESDRYLNTLDMPENIWLVAYVLRWSLWEYRHSPLHETLMHAISYVFSCSGNSSVLCGIKNQEQTLQEEQLQIGWNDAYMAGRLIAENLEDHADENYRNLSWTLKWLFSCSGNSCVDWDEETMYSVELLQWNPDDLAFAVHMIEEANEIMSNAMVGIEYFKQNPIISIALWCHIQQIYYYSMTCEDVDDINRHVSWFWPEIIK